jgi:hypothetical protein
LIHAAIGMYFAYKNNPKTKILSYMKYFGINMVQIGWLVYGNIIYFDTENG